MRIPGAVAGWLTLVLGVAVMAAPFGAAPSARAGDTPDSGVLVFDLGAETTTIDEHTARIIWNLNGDNLVEGPVSESWISSYLEKPGKLGGRVVLDLDAGTVSGEIIERWTCADGGANCERWSTRDAEMIATITGARIERDAGAWRIVGKDTVSISYRAWGGWDEPPSDCGGVECYVCENRYCTFDSKDAGLASLDGRLEDTTLSLSFADRLQADVDKMDFSGLRRTVFFMSRFSMKVTAAVPDSTITTQPAAEATIPDETVLAPAVDAGAPVDASGGDADAGAGDGDQSTTLATGSAGAPSEDDGAGGLGSLILTIALVFGVGVAALLLRNLLRKPSAESPAAAPAGVSKSTAKKPVAQVVSIKITNDETKRILEWGVKNNRPPEDIQRDVDARNESLGGSGVVPVTNAPKRINLPQGAVTVTPAEHAEYGRRTTEVANQLDDARIHRGVMEKLAAKSRYWSAIDRAVILRWIVGTKKIYDQGLKMNNPDPWLARKSGFDNVEDMLAAKYGKPTWLTYETHRYGSMTEAIEAWKKEPDGGWARFQAARSNAIDTARSRLRTMLARPVPTGEVKSLWTPGPTNRLHVPNLDRLFLGPNVEAPAELFPSHTPAVRNMSWYNRPAHELKQIMEAQRRGVEYLRATQRALNDFLKYESDLARRIPTPAG